MKKYLSIGELSKLKSVSIKSLRYYDKIGILKPAYVNPETNYRYYSLDQLLILDIILTCIDLGVPLSKLKDYELVPGNLNLKKLIEDGNNLPQNKLTIIKNMILKLKALSVNIENFENIKELKSIYSRYFEKRYFLISPFNEKPSDTHNFTKIFNNLYSKGKEMGEIILYNQGWIFKCSSNKIDKYFFIEISPTFSLADNILILPKGDYSCTLFPSDNFLKEWENIDSSNCSKEKFVVFSEIFDSQFDNHSYFIEKQILIK